MTNINISFLGAAKTVTGSCYLLNIDDAKYLVDCGMFQGPDVSSLNYNDFSFDPAQIKAVFLTHAHIDHSGLIPKLYARGFNGKIYATRPTTRILTHLLPDSAKVQESNQRFRGMPSLYDLDNALQAVGSCIDIQFDKPFNVDALELIYMRSSHILGAASIEIKAGNKHLCFSGDIGRRKPTIIRGFGDHGDNFDYLIMESLYGNKSHEDFDLSIEKLTTIINDTINRDGNVIIPLFALHRSQEILHIINNLIDKGKIDNNVQIFFDSPLGERILKVYTEEINEYSDEFSNFADPFGLRKRNIQFVQKNRDSVKLRKKRGAIILAGGGMSEGGRVMNHISSFASDSKSSYVIVGFQAEGTLGREIIARPKVINVDKTQLKLKMQIHEIYGFSAHGDRDDLKWWLNRFNKESVSKVFLMHSEPEQSSAFIDYCDKSHSFIVPSINDSFDL